MSLSREEKYHNPLVEEEYIISTLISLSDGGFLWSNHTTENITLVWLYKFTWITDIIYLCTFDLYKTNPSCNL
jgi:hypothetical protein